MTRNGKSSGAGALSGEGLACLQIMRMRKAQRLRRTLAAETNTRWWPGATQTRERYRRTGTRAGFSVTLVSEIVSVERILFFVRGLGHVFLVVCVCA
ncbi:hypothetical protein DEO72_LG5g1 [Vigna unguiculata]|uniref:Uncharacterized protein n=1 Tax=Vigna unguiculata TaxID=3917 RepID=A0A4D6LVB6_VIGUN|nr:hypothetical protein DEO72_LG5g1 [Vigna unguiculata]